VLEDGDGEVNMHLWSSRSVKWVFLKKISYLVYGTHSRHEKWKGTGTRVSVQQIQSCRQEIEAAVGMQCASRKYDAIRGAPSI